MKRILSIILIAVLALSGCADTPHPHDTEIYDSTPEEVHTDVFVNGVRLAVYEGFRAKLSDLFANLGGQITNQNVTQSPYTCSFSLGKTEFEIRTDSSIANKIPLGSFPLFDGADWYVAAEPLLTMAGAHKFSDSESGRIYFTEYPDSKTVPNGVQVPVLMYHAVSDEIWGIESLFVSPSELEKQLKYIVENGYTPIHFEQLGDIDNIEKPVILTFDDGYEDNYTELFPLLKKYQVKATVFMIMSKVGHDTYLTEDEIKQMSDSGLVSVQSHTVNHPFLSEQGESSLDRELLGSKLALARITGKEPFVLCYPTGKYSALSLKKTAQYYQYGLIMGGPRYVTGNNPYKIARYYIRRSTSVSDLAAILS